MSNEDRLKMTKAKLPQDVRKTIGRLTKDFDAASKASIESRAGSTLTKLERADGKDKKS